MKEYIKIIVTIFLYTVTTIFGLFLIITWDRSLEIVRYGAIFTVGLIIVAHVIQRLIIQRQWTIQAFLQLLSYGVLFVITYWYFNAMIATLLISIGGGIWLFIDGLIKCFYGIQRFWQQRLLALLYLLFGFVTLVFAIILIQLDEQAFYFVRLFLGSYFIVFGLFHLLDLIFRRSYFIQRLKRVKLFEMKPRTLFSIYSPRTFRLHYDELSSNEKSEFKKAYHIDKKIKPEVQLHVYVHMKYPVADMFGHVDFAFDGTNYTYGNYDESTLKWHANKSEGVLIISPNHKYLALNVKQYRKIIASFTLNITEAQRNQLIKTLDTIIVQEAYDWNPDMMTRKTSYSKTIKRHLQSLFYKFKPTSTHHSYITATNNCVNFFDTVISDAGIKIFPNQNITAPGDIFNILNMCAEDETDHLVVKRRLLTREDFKEEKKHQ